MNAQAFSVFCSWLLFCIFVGWFNGTIGQPKYFHVVLWLFDVVGIVAMFLILISKSFNLL